MLTYNVQWRFMPHRDDEKRDSLTDELQQQLASAASSKKPTETRLTPDQLQEVGWLTWGPPN